MKWFNEPVPAFKHSVLTMGNFDGMHLGHQKVLAELIKQSEQLKLPPVVLTYLEHPGHFVHFKHPVPILTPRILKKSLISSYGVKEVFFLNFTSETAHTNAQEFLREVLISYFHPQVIVAGYDMHFGYQREGNADFLRLNEIELNYKTVQIKPVLYKDEIISSSQIREHISKGSIQIANAMLGKPYRLYGTVTHGKKLGRAIGFPTINLNLLDREQLIPADGVYLSSITLQDKQYFGLTNIGTSPTLKNTAQIEIETHIPDFKQEVYDAQVSLDLLVFIRAEQKFTSAEELRKAISDDIEAGKKFITELK